MVTKLEQSSVKYDHSSTKFIFKAYPAAAEWKKFVFSWDLYSIFLFLTFGHFINEAFVLLLLEQQNDVNPICWVIETTKRLIIEVQEA